MTVYYDDLEVGTELPPGSYAISRADLIRYAGASGDFNVIHWNQRVAHEVGLPDVIAHGMLTMATAARALTDWLGDPGAIVEYGVRFTRPVVVPDDGIGAMLEVTGKVTELLEDKRAKVELTVSSAGAKVLGQSRATVRLG